jgi:acyl-CoA thioester hydrolase
MTRTPESWPDLAGRLTATGHVLPVRVYFEDTDFSGVVYHANYLKFLERGRTDFLRLLGIGHAALEAGGEGDAVEGLVFAVRHMTLDFLKPARIDELLEVDTELSRTTGARIVLRQAVRRGDAVLVAAEVTVALINRAGRARRLPEAMRGRLVAGRTS